MAESANENLQLRLRNDQGKAYTGYTMSVQYRLKATADGPSGGLAGAGAEVAGDGRTRIEMPAAEAIDGKLRVVVRDPTGRVVLDRPYTHGELARGGEITVRPRELPVIDTLPRPDLTLRKLVGWVLRQRGSRTVGSVQVTVAVQKTAGDPFQVLFATRTDAQGYFSTAYPLGRFASAQASVGNHPELVPIHLDNGAFPERIFLSAEFADLDACPLEKVPRVPDAVDLTSSPGIYSSDADPASCVDFHDKPDRSLHEFLYHAVVRTTQPEVRALYRPRVTQRDPSTADLPQVEMTQHGPGQLEGVALPGANLDLHTANIPDQLAGLASKPAAELPAPIPERALLTASNSIHWDSQDGSAYDNAYEATTIAHGHVLCFKQSWHADGYSLGDLLYSVPLAPCQKKQIAIIDWDRRETGARSEALTQTEALTGELTRDRDITEAVDALVSESLDGGSSSQSGAISASGGLSGILGGFLGISGGYSGSSSSAWQDSARGVAATFGNLLHDRTMQRQASMRQLRSTVIQTVGQHETVRAETEVIVNHNHCHAITIQYFEVLRHFVVRRELASAQECLFIPLPMSLFDRRKTYRWQDILRRYLRKSRLGGGFKAIERLLADGDYAKSADTMVADKPLSSIHGTLWIEFHLVRPEDDQKGDYIEAFWKWFSIHPFCWNAKEFHKLYIKTTKEKDRVFQEQLGPVIVETLLRGLEVDNGNVTINFDATLLDAYQPGRSLRVAVRTPGPGQTRSKVRELRFSFPEAGEQLSPYSKIVLKSADLRYRYSDDFREHRLYGGEVNDDLITWKKPETEAGNGQGEDDTEAAKTPETIVDKARLDAPLMPFELRKPYDDDVAEAKALVDHLNEHIEYYHHAIWRQMSPARRFMLLDNYQAPGADGRSVASVVENKIIAIAGNSLVMPVAPGNRLDPTFKAAGDDPDLLFKHYAPTVPPPSIRFTVPTKGVFAEAVMGSCNSCEKKDDNRFWRWEEAPCGDEPTPLEPVSTESRRTQPADLGVTPFAAPIVNLQNAPAAPDPTGLTGALQLLGNANLFRDVTGLSETQRNTLGVLQTSMAAAQTAAGEAARLAQTDMILKGSNHILESIKSAREQQLITGEQAQDLTHNMLRGMLGETRQPAPSLSDSSHIQALLAEVPKMFDPKAQGETKLNVSTPYGSLNLQRQLPSLIEEKRADKLPDGGNDGVDLEDQTEANGTGSSTDTNKDSNGEEKEEELEYTPLAGIGTCPILVTAGVDGLNLRSTPDDTSKTNKLAQIPLGEILLVNGLRNVLNSAKKMRTWFATDYQDAAGTTHSGFIYGNSTVGRDLGDQVEHYLSAEHNSEDPVSWCLVDHQTPLAQLIAAFNSKPGSDRKFDEIHHYQDDPTTNKDDPNLTMGFGNFAAGTLPKLFRQMLICPGQWDAAAWDKYRNGTVQILWSQSPDAWKDLVTATHGVIATNSSSYWGDFCADTQLGDPNATAASLEKVDQGLRNLMIVGDLNVWADGKVAGSANIFNAPGHWFHDSMKQALLEEKVATYQLAFWLEHFLEEAKTEAGRDLLGDVLGAVASICSILSTGPDTWSNEYGKLIRGSKVTIAGGHQFDAGSLPSKCSASTGSATSQEQLDDWRAFIIWQYYRAYKGEVRDRMRVIWRRWFQATWGTIPATASDDPVQPHSGTPMPRGQFTA